MSISASGETSFPSGRDNLLIQTALAGGSHGCPDALAPPELLEALDRSKRVAVRESVHGPRVAVPRPEDAPGEPFPNRSPRRDGDGWTHLLFLLRTHGPQPDAGSSARRIGATIRQGGDSGGPPRRVSGPATLVDRGLHRDCESLLRRLVRPLHVICGPRPWPR